MWALLLGTDPGLLRLRLALRAVVAIGLTMAVAAAVGPSLGVPPVVLMLFGGVIGMNGAFVTSGRPPWDAVRAVLVLPVPAAVGMLAAAAAGGHHAAMLAGFVVVMVAATFVRRLGPQWLTYGMVAWMGYFFGSFLGMTAAAVGRFEVIVVVAAAALAAVSAVAADRPSTTLAAAVRAFTVRVHDLVRAAVTTLERGSLPERASWRLEERAARVTEAALVIDGYLASAGERPAQAARVRHAVIDLELAAEQLAATCRDLSRRGLPADVRACLLRVLAGEADRAECAEPDPALRPLLDSFVAAANTLHRGLAECGDPPAHARDAYQPAVALNLGQLPSSVPSAEQVAASSGRPSLRLSLNTRLCVQVGVATALAVIAGNALSPHRYYWAVLASFLALTGTFTTGEIIAKGFNRVLGTLVGIFAAGLAVHLTGRDGDAVIGVTLVCVFLGVYFLRVSYGVMAFAVTTVMGELYNVLREFTDALLLLRLEETAVGAVLAIGTALLVLPVRSRDARRYARAQFSAAVDQLAGHVRDRLAGAETPASDLLLDARRVDASLHQLALVTRPPLGASLLGRRGRRELRELAGYSATAYQARRLAAAVAHADLLAPAAGTAADLPSGSDHGVT